MRKTSFLFFFILIFILTQYNIVLAKEQGISSQYAKAKVIEIIKENNKNTLGDIITGCQEYKVQVLSGSFKGKVLSVHHQASSNPIYNLWVNKGDEIILILNYKGTTLTNVQVESYLRDKYIFYLILLFLLILLFIGKKSGLKSIITLILTVLIISTIMLPLILKGLNPIKVTLVSCIIITILTLVIIGGISRKTLSAIIGTSGGLYVSTQIALLFGNLTKISGLCEEEAQSLIYNTSNCSIDFQGILFAGIIIGALGAIMDVSMSIASSLEEIRTVGRNLTIINLIRSGMNIGRDIMGTMSNTLILAYTGASLHLLLYLMVINPPFVKFTNMEFLAIEFIRALSGSIGLILAIPITTFVAGIIMKL